MSGELVHYEAACREIALAATIDEAKEWADKSAALRAYARQAHNTELEVQVAEIRLRALRRLGELSAALEKAETLGHSGEVRLPSAGKSKSDTLREAGVSTSQAHRCEQLADVPAPEFEQYLAEQRDLQEPASAAEVVARSRGLGVHFSSQSIEHYTPAWVLERVVAVMGGIDLDPCSNSHDEPNVPAEACFTKEDEGLNREWHGRVFMNPPYGDEIHAWTEKLADEFASGRVTQAIALVPARTDTGWWHKLITDDRYWCLVHFLKGRLKFGSAESGAPFPSALIYLGDRRALFVETLQKDGISYQPLHDPEMTVFVLGESEEAA